MGVLEGMVEQDSCAVDRQFAEMLVGFGVLSEQYELVGGISPK